MNEHVKHEQETPEAELSVMAMLKKIQQQLNFLEMKIDKLMGQNSGRPSFNRERQFGGRPFRPSGGGGGGFRHDRNEHGDKSRNKEFGSGPERQFGKPFEPKHTSPDRGRKAFFRRTQKSKNRGPFQGR